MPRSHDGPVPQRPERNEMSGRMADIFDHIRPHRANDGQDQGPNPRLNDALDRGEHAPGRVKFDIAGHDQGPGRGDVDEGAAKRASVADANESAADLGRFTEDGGRGFLHGHDLPSDWFFS